ncbi:hypothetical protein [Brevundimonas diminuta]|uniref:hypothetical protein n=1 Tax=Brevundimonas diminuta TaxID=293 RepID=UPI003F7F68F9
MPVGFQSVTSAGVVQIDENYLCLSLRQKGEATASTAHPMSLGSTWVMRYHDLTFTSPDVPILALRVAEASPVVMAGVIAVTRSGNNWTFRVLVVGQSSSSFLFQYWLFDRPSAPIGNGFGLIVRGADGKVVFNSNDPVLRVVGQGAGNYGSGKTYAFAYNALINYFHDIVDNTPNGWLTTETVAAWGCYCTSTGVARVQRTVYGDVLRGPAQPRFSPGSGLDGWGGGGLNYGYPPAEMSLLVIDVTGL